MGIGSRTRGWNIAELPQNPPKTTKTCYYLQALYNTRGHPDTPTPFRPAALLTHPVYGANLLRELANYGLPPQIDVHLFLFPSHTDMQIGDTLNKLIMTMASIM